MTDSQKSTLCVMGRTRQDSFFFLYFSSCVFISVTVGENPCDTFVFLPSCRGAGCERCQKVSESRPELSSKVGIKCSDGQTIG